MKPGSQNRLRDGLNSPENAALGSPNTRFSPINALQWFRRRLDGQLISGSLGELVIATGADALSADELHRHLTATLVALNRNRAARNRHQAHQARYDMRTWQVERRKRTRHLIELGGFVVKAGIVDLTGDDRTVIYGALLWAADKLRSGEREKALALWAAKGKQAFEMERDGTTLLAAQDHPDGA